MQTVNLAANNSNNSLCVTKTKVIRFIYKSTNAITARSYCEKMFSSQHGFTLNALFLHGKKKANHLLVRAISKLSNCFWFVYFLFVSLFVILFVCFFVCLFLRLFVSSGYDCENSMNTRREYFDLDV